MRCHIGIMSEFEGSFTESVFNAIFEYNDDNAIFGAADVGTQQAWVFIDNIVNRGGSLGWIVRTIVGTTVHELIHLYGYEDEGVAKRGESLLAWDGGSRCYLPLPMW